MFSTSHIVLFAYMRHVLKLERPIVACPQVRCWVVQLQQISTMDLINSQTDSGHLKINRSLVEGLTYLGISHAY